MLDRLFIYVAIYLAKTSVVYFILLEVSFCNGEAAWRLKTIYVISILEYLQPEGRICKHELKVGSATKNLIVFHVFGRYQFCVFILLAVSFCGGESN